MKKLIGKTIILTFSSDNKIINIPKIFQAKILKNSDCSTGQLLVTNYKGLIILIAPRYVENSLDDLTLEPMVVHIAKFVGKGSIPDFIDSKDIINWGIGTAKLA